MHTATEEGELFCPHGAPLVAITNNIRYVVTNQIALLQEEYDYQIMSVMSLANQRQVLHGIAILGRNKTALNKILPMQYRNGGRVPDFCRKTLALSAIAS